MFMSQGLERDIENLRKDWEAVGDYLGAAMQDVATELGGEELAETVEELSASDELLPDPRALGYLEDLYPGSAEQVMIRSAEIQKRAHKRQIAEQENELKLGFRDYGRAILGAFPSMFDITGRRTFDRFNRNNF